MKQGVIPCLMARDFTTYLPDSVTVSEHQTQEKSILEKTRFIRHLLNLTERQCL